MELCFTAAWHHCWPLPGGSRWLLSVKDARSFLLAFCNIRNCCMEPKPGGTGSEKITLSLERQSAVTAVYITCLMCFYPLQQGHGCVGWWALLWNSWDIEIPQPEDGSRKNSCPNSAGVEDLLMSPEITEWVCGSVKLHFCLLLWTQNFLTSCCWVVLVCQPGLELSWTSPQASGVQWCLSAHRRSCAQIFLRHRWGE